MRRSVPLIQCWNIAACVVLRVQACTEDGRDFTVEFEAAWDCYLPFVRHYGDALSFGFQCIPFFAKNKVSAVPVVLLLSFAFTAC